MRSFQDHIRAILDRGEPIDYEGLLKWPEPPVAGGDAELLERALRGLTPPEYMSMDEDDDLPVDVAPPAEDIATPLFPSEEEQRLIDMLEKAHKRPHSIPHESEFSDRPLDVAAIIVADCRVDWRTRIRAQTYFDDASSIYFAIHKMVEYLVEELPQNLLHPRQLGPVRKAIDLTWSLRSIQLGMVHLVFAACISKVSKAIQRLLNQVTLDAEQIAALSRALQPLDDETLYAKSLVGERVFGLDSIRRETGHALDGNRWWHDVGGRKTGKHAHYLAYMEDLIDIARGPSHMWLDRSNEVRRSFESKVSAKDPLESIEGLWMVVYAILGALTKLRLCLGALYVLRDPKATLASAPTVPYIDPYTGERLECSSDGAQIRLWSEGSSMLVEPLEFIVSLQTRGER